MGGGGRARARLGLILRVSVLPLLLLSLGWTTAPQLLRLALEAHELQPLSLAARRTRVDGPIVSGVLQVKRALRPGEPVALIGPLHNHSPLIFANYYGYPWVSRDYAGLDHYRASAGAPGRPRTIAAVSDAGAHRAAYAELRDERLRQRRIADGGLMRPVPPRFASPLVGS